MTTDKMQESKINAKGAKLKLESQIEHGNFKLKKLDILTDNAACNFVTACHDDITSLMTLLETTR